MPTTANNDKTYIGTIFLLCGVAFLMVAWILNGPDRHALKHFQALQTSTMSTLQPGDFVLVHGWLGPLNPIWEQGLVIGTRQVYKGGEDGWEDERGFNGILTLSLSDRTTLQLQVNEGLLPRGRYTTIEHPTNQDMRWVGYLPRAELTCWGEFITQFPKIRIEINESACFGGDEEEFLADVNTENRGLGLFGLLSLLGGAYFIGYGLRHKNAGS